MAISSFFGYVEIDTKDKVDAFVHALEESERKPKRKVDMAHTATDADSKWVRERLATTAK